MTEVLITLMQTHSFFFDESHVNGTLIKTRLSQVENIPYNDIFILYDGNIVKDNDVITGGLTILRAYLENDSGIRGGKGGFGAMLRRKAKEKGPKKTVDFGACRDLSGRRIRHVNDEIILKKWQDAKDKGQEFNIDEATPSGINLWFLPTPSWTEGFGKKVKNSRRKAKRKTSLCSDWLEAHGPDKRVPKNAPVWWGCPRGNRCDYAHGEIELETNAKKEFDDQKRHESQTIESDKLNAYLNSNNNKDDVNDLVQAGLSKSFKRARTAPSSSSSSAAAAASADTLLSSVIQTSSGTQASSSNDDSPAVDSYGGEEEEEEEEDNDDEEENEHQLIASKSECEWLEIVSGDAAVMDDGAVIGQNDFSTIKLSGTTSIDGSTGSTAGCSLHDGKWFYEVELRTNGLMQIGWGCTGFTSAASSEGDGVGDDQWSWSYDGCRLKKWHVEAVDYGGPRGWEIGDVIGCAIEFTHNSSNSSSNSGGSNSNSGGSNSNSSSNSSSSSAETDTVKMIFYKNGESLGEAFSIPATPTPSSTSTSSTSNTTITTTSTNTTTNKSYFPAFSVDSFQQIIVNIGQNPFKYPPSSYASSPTADTTSTTTPPTIYTHFKTDIKQMTKMTEDVDESQFTPLVDLESEKYLNYSSLVVLGGQYLKYELRRRGLKCGGTVEERALRLHSVRGVSEKDIPSRLKQSNELSSSASAGGNKKQKQK